MTSRTKIFSAAAAAAILLATVAVARTVHTHTALAVPAMQQTTTGNAAAHAPRHNFACATAVESECDKFDWFPE